MTDFVDLLRLFEGEDEEALRAREDAWANDGRDPSDVTNWTDTRPGTLFQLFTEGGVREGARLYERMSEVLAMSFPQFAGGTYLDDIAEARGLERGPASFATGTVTFTGDAGTDIATGTSVSVAPSSPDDEPPSFLTTTDATIGGGGTVDVPVRASDAGEMWNVAPRAITIIDTQTPGLVSVLNADATTSGSDPQDDPSLSTELVAQFRDTGGATEARYVSWALGFNSSIGRVAVRPLYYGAGSVLVIVSQKDGSPVSSAYVQGLQDYLDPPSFRTHLNGGLTLPAGTITVDSTIGAAVATTSDPAFLRIGEQLVRYTGQTGTTFTGVTGGTGTFTSGTEVSQSGKAHGVAPVGHHVVVRTSETVTINLVATIEPDDGYSVDGSGSTVALRVPIEAAVAAYLATCQPGDEIVYKHVLSAVISTPGVHDVPTLTIEGSTSNIPLSAVPSQYPVLVTPTSLTD